MFFVLFDLPFFESLLIAYSKLPTIRVFKFVIMLIQIKAFFSKSTVATL